jgi:hypothetical protein
MATVLYIRTNGSDSNNGTLASPFGTAQKAFNVAYAAGSGDYVLNFGAGTFSGINLHSVPGGPVAWPSRISVVGAGNTVSFLGGIYAKGVSSLSTDVPATDGFGITITSDNSINLGDINCDGGDDNYGDQNSYPVNGNGGYIGLVNCTFGSISSSGGSANNSSSGSQDKGAGGTVQLSNCTGLDVNVNGSYCGRAGTITASNSTLHDLSANSAQDGNDCSNAASGGTITITNCTVHSISAGGGNTNTGIGGGPGTFSQTNSTVTGVISLTHGSPQPDCLGYLGGDAINDCLQNCYSPSNENGAAYTDPKGNICNYNSQDPLGYCCGDAWAHDCNHANYSPSNEDQNTITDNLGNTCHINSTDALGYCCGDAIIGCGNQYYSPKNEDGYTFTDLNGVSCNSGLVDNLNYCCGDATTDCGGHLYSPSNENNNSYNTLYTDSFGHSCTVDSIETVGINSIQFCCASYYGICGDSSGYTCYCNSMDDFGFCPANAGGCYRANGNVGEDGGACYSQDCNGTQDYTYNFVEDTNGAFCFPGSKDALGLCCGHCQDGSACGENSSGCLYYNCDGSCSSSVSNPTCCPSESDVRVGVNYYCNGAHTGTLQLGTAKSKVILSSILGIPIF